MDSVAFYKMALRLEELGYAVRVGTHFRVGAVK